MSNLGESDQQQWLGAFGKAVREARKEMGLSQEKLGFRCGLDRTYVSGIERGVRNPTIWTICRLALGLETKVSLLLQVAEEHYGTDWTRR